MASTLVSVEEYLHTSYEPDAEYVDGVVEERPMGEGKHSEWQGTLSFFFKAHRHEWEIRIRPEFRTQTGERRYRVPDFAVVEAAAAEEQIATTPPLIAFEILSPEDRLSRLVVRLADFEAMGVPAIYVIDPPRQLPSPIQERQARQRQHNFSPGACDSLRGHPGRVGLTALTEARAHR